MAYVIAEWNIGRLMNKIEELNAAAEKLGCEPIKVEVGAGRLQKHEGSLIQVFDVSVTGVAPVIEGWQFVAKIDHDERGDVVQSFQEVPVEFFNRGPVCDHCGYNRNRKQTFVLVKDGEYKQVGSTCLKDFTGHADPLAVADYYASLEGMDEVFCDFEDLEWGGGPNYEYVYLDDYMACVVASYNDSGWVSRSDMGFATADDAIGRYIDKEFSDVESAEAVKIVDWARNEFDIESMNQYEHNMAVIFSDKVIRYRDIGYAASAIIGYKKSLDVETDSEYVGKVKDRIDVELRLVMTRVFEGFYGPSKMYKFLDSDGNIFVWFTGSADLEEGETYRGKGTVKEHKEYNGQKQTIITRCKLEKVE